MKKKREELIKNKLNCVLSELILMKKILKCLRQTIKYLDTLKNQ